MLIIKKIGIKNKKNKCNKKVKEVFLSTSSKKWKLKRYNNKIIINFFLNILFVI